MAEIEITIPTIQYGNVKVTATPEELGIKDLDPYAVGYWAAIYLNLAGQGFKKGASEDLGPSEGVTEAQAQRYLEDGLGGVTVVENEESPTDQAGAPWDRPAPAAKKPWEETSAPASKPVVDSGW